MAGPAMFGFLNVHKPVGISSFDVIRHVRRCLKRRTKLGHAGTLDPLAEGVLLVCLGPATRLADVVGGMEKEYVTSARLGATSSTDDAEGQIQPTPEAPPPAVEAVAEAVRRFVGSIRQVPPAYSAVKVAGQRAYALARRGQSVELAAREVTIHSLSVLRYDWPELTLRMTCGRGTYVRAVVRDLGAELGVGAYCRTLTRTRVGPFRLPAAVKLEELTRETILPALIPAVEAFGADARVALGSPAVAELALGRAVALPNLPAGAARHGELAATDPAGRLAAVVRPDRAGGRLQPVKVFVRPV